MSGLAAFVSLFLTAAGVVPAAETDTVATLEDAADDPAIWIHPTAPEKSLILGTDKTAGLRVYDLDGREIQFLEIGRLNNVDLRPGVSLIDAPDAEGTPRTWTGDLAAATNRTDDSVVLFSVDETGAVPMGRFSTAPEPYGFCMGRDGGVLTLFVAHKQGFVQPFALTRLDEPPRVLPPLFFDSQIEGCVYDDFARRLFVGEEAIGIWAVPFRDGAFIADALTLIDRVGDGGLVADVEGLTLYQDREGHAVLIASSQGDDSFQLYAEQAEGAWVRRPFAVVADLETGIDGVQETDGIAAAFGPLGPAYPRGILVVQDGFNVGTDLSRDGRTPDEEPLAPQNFKIVDFRTIEAWFNTSGTR